MLTIFYRQGRTERTEPSERVIEIIGCTAGFAEPACFQLEALPVRRLCLVVWG